MSSFNDTAQQNNDQALTASKRIKFVEDEQQHVETTAISSSAFMSLDKVEMERTHAIDDANENDTEVDEDEENMMDDLQQLGAFVNLRWTDEKYRALGESDRTKKRKRKHARDLAEAASSTKSITSFFMIIPKIQVTTTSPNGDKTTISSNVGPMTITSTTPTMNTVISFYSSISEFHQSAF